MHPVPIRGSLPILALLLALAGCGDDGQRGPPSSGAVAYIVTSCRQTSGTMTLQQEVRILRGDAEAVTAVSIGPLGPFPSLWCGAVGSYRGWFYQQSLQRFGTTPGPGVPEHPFAELPIAEVFVTDGTNVLRLTDFHRTDTTLFLPFYSARDRCVYFTAAADPLGTNPTKNCQIFSIEPVSLDLRQLTFFRESAAHAANGCVGGRRPNGCRIDFSWSASQPSQNPHTGTVFFKSSCDPFGQNPNGQQLFAMQPDGSGLRQLSNAHGVIRGADGTIEVETVDAFWSAPS